MVKHKLLLGIAFSFLIYQSSSAQCSVDGTTPGTACFGSSGTVTATPSAGSAIRWFTQATGGVALDTGNTFTIPVVTAPGTYYAEAFGGGGVTSDSLNTLTPNNGQAGAVFDCKPLVNMTVKGFNFVAYSSASFTFSIYYKVGTFVGSETNSGAWTLLGTSSSFSAPGNVFTAIPINFSVNLTANQVYSFYFYGGGSTIGYTNGSTLGAIATSNADLEIYQGKGCGGLFSSSLFTPRTFSGTMKYEIGSSCNSTRVPVALTLADPTEIVNQTHLDTACVGVPVDLFVESKGTALNYRWQIFDNKTSGFVDITGNPFILNGDTLNITQTPDTLNGAIIRCISMGMCGEDTSADMNLAVTPLPAVVTPPEDITLNQGDDATFRVVAAGVGIQYQWQVGVNGVFSNINNGGIYSGVYTNTLRVSGVSRVQNEFQFRCIVKGVGNCAAQPDTSTFGVLYVNPPASVGGIASDNSIVVYPNPVGGSSIMIRVAASLQNMAGYSIVDKLGRIVATGKLNSSGTTDVDVAALAPAVYTIHIVDADHLHSKSIRFTRL